MTTPMGKDELVAPGGPWDWSLPPLTDNDEVHRQLALGATERAMAQLETLHEYGEYDLTLPTSDVIQEAAGAWVHTGLVHEDYTERNRLEIVNAIISEVATVLVLVGWRPPDRLLSGVSPQDATPVAPSEASPK